MDIDLETCSPAEMILFGPQLASWFQTHSDQLVKSLSTIDQDSFRIFCLLLYNQGLNLSPLNGKVTSGSNGNLITAIRYGLKVDLLDIPRSPSVWNAVFSYQAFLEPLAETWTKAIDRSDDVRVRMLISFGANPTIEDLLHALKYIDRPNGLRVIRSICSRVTPPMGILQPYITSPLRDRLERYLSAGKVWIPPEYFQGINLDREYRLDQIIYSKHRQQISFDGQFAWPYYMDLSHQKLPSGPERLNYFVVDSELPPTDEDVYRSAFAGLV